MPEVGRVRPGGCPGRLGNPDGPPVVWGNPDGFPVVLGNPDGFPAIPPRGWRVFVGRRGRRGPFVGNCARLPHRWRGQGAAAPWLAIGVFCRGDSIALASGAPCRPRCRPVVPGLLGATGGSGAGDRARRSGRQRGTEPAGGRGAGAGGAGGANPRGRDDFFCREGRRCCLTRSRRCSTRNPTGRWPGGPALAGERSRACSRAVPLCWTPNSSPPSPGSGTSCGWCGGAAHGGAGADCQDFPAVAVIE